MEEFNVLRSLLALGFVLALVLAMGWLMRRWDLTRLAGKMQEGRRLRLREQMHLDARRKVVLFSCDGADYMAVLGAQGEQVIQLSESRIQNSAGENNAA